MSEKQIRETEQVGKMVRLSSNNFPAMYAFFPCGLVRLGFLPQVFLYPILV